MEKVKGISGHAKRGRPREDRKREAEKSSPSRNAFLWVDRRCFYSTTVLPNSVLHMKI